MQIERGEGYATYETGEIFIHAGVYTSVCVALDGGPHKRAYSRSWELGRSECDVTAEAQAKYSEVVARYLANGWRERA